MHICRCKVYHDLFARDSEPHGLKGCDSPQKALLDCGISQSYEVYSDALGNVYFYCYRDCFDSDTFRAMDVYQHVFFLQICTAKKEICSKKRKMW